MGVCRGIWYYYYVVTRLVRQARTMEKINSEEFKENSGKSETGFSLMNLVIGIVMVAIGYQNLPAEDRGVDPAGLSEAEKTPCPNGAAYWLYVAGICLLVSNSINTWAKMYKKCAERDGKIDCGEKVGLAVNKMSSGVMTIVDFVMLIWGSVVVFGAWANWTDEWDVAQQDAEKNYCMYTPMMTAFVLLLIKWVMIPVMIAITCCCACFTAMCCASCAPSSETA